MKPEDMINLNDTEMEKVTGGDNVDEMRFCTRIMNAINEGKAELASAEYNAYKRALNDREDKKVRKAFKEKFGHEIDAPVNR